MSPVAITPKRYVSTEIFYDSGVTITNAKPQITLSAGSIIKLYLSTQTGDDNWEEVTNGETHTFTTPGKQLRYYIICQFGSKMTDVKIQYNI